MKKYGLILFIVLILLCFALLLIFIKRYVPGVYINNDFFDYYIGSRLFWLHKNIYGPNAEFVRLVQLYDLKFMWATGYSYLPFFAMIFYPFLFLSPQIAALLWIVGNTFFYGLITYFISSRRKGRLKYITAFFMLTFMPCLYSISAGQINILFLFLLYRYIYEDQAKGIYLGISSIFKIYPFMFFLKEILQKRWKTIFVGFCSIAIFLTLPVIFDGGKNTLDYFLRVLPSLNNTPHTYYINQSVNGVLSRLFSAVSKNDQIIIPQTTLVFMNVGISFIALCLLCLLTEFNKNNRALSLFWLGCLTLIAGKNSFWNFAPCVLIGIFLLDNWKQLTTIQKMAYIFSVFITNFAWNGVSYFERIIPVVHLAERLIYVVTSSLGFFALVIQLFLLKSFFIPRKPFFINRFFNINHVGVGKK